MRAFGAWPCTLPTETASMSHRTAATNSATCAGSVVLANSGATSSSLPPMLPSSASRATSVPHIARARADTATFSAKGSSEASIMIDVKSAASAASTASSDLPWSRCSATGTEQSASRRATVS